MSIELLDLRQQWARYERAAPAGAMLADVRALLAQDRVHGLFAVRDGAVAAVGVLAPMDWDTQFFGRPMARLAWLDAADPEPGRALLAGLEARARAAGVVHILARLARAAYGAMWSLEDAGYRLVVVGTTFIARRAECAPRRSASAHRIRPMAEADLEAVLAFGTTLFTGSYFYRDPFFSRAEADALHRAWITNLYRELARVVWVCEVDGRAIGFMTCEIKGTPAAGSIALVGVDPRHAGRGIASALLARTLAWFFEQGVDAVTVKTQSFNYPALHLYAKGGMHIHLTDVTYVKTLA